MSIHSHSIAENSAARKRTGRVDRDHTDLHAFPSNYCNQAIDERALASARGAGDSDEKGATRAGIDLADYPAARVAVVFDERDRFGNRTRITRGNAGSEICNGVGSHYSQNSLVLVLLGQAASARIGRILIADLG